MSELVSAKQISLLYRKFQKYLNQEMKPFDINSSEYAYLLLLYENRSALSQDELVKLSCVDKAAVTRAITSLEKKGFISKLASSTNSRRNTIKLTNKGEAVKDDLLRVVMQWNHLLHQGIDSKNLNITIDSLNTMVQNGEKL